jgi:hypothetical protein
MRRGATTALTLAALVLALSAVITTASVARSQILPDAFEPDDSPDAAKPLELDGLPQRHSFHVPGDRDWVRFPVEAGARIRLFTTGAACDPVLTLFAPNGVVALLEDDDSGGASNPSMEVVLSEAGTYFARVRAYSDAETCESYDLVGALSDASAAQTPAPSPSPPAQVSVTPVATVAPTGATPLTNVTPTPTATPTLAAVVPTETVSPTPEAVPTDIPALIPDIPPPADLPNPTATLFEDLFEADDTPDQAGTLPLTGLPQGRSFHTSTDVDWIAVPLDFSDILVVFTTGACDTHLTLYGPDATSALAEDEEGAEEANAALIYRARTQGTHFVRVRLFPGRDPCEAYELIGFVSRAAAEPSPIPVPTAPPPATPTQMPSATPTPVPVATTTTPGITSTPVRFTTATPTSPVGL